MTDLQRAAAHQMAAATRRLIVMLQPLRIFGAGTLDPIVDAWLAWEIAKHLENP